MNNLSSARRMVDSPAPPKSEEDGWVYTINCAFKELEVLGLSTTVPSAPPKK